MELAEVHWRKSSHSGGGQNGDCVEVAFAGSAVALRDSKAPNAGVLVVAPAAWKSFLQHNRESC
ncbi:protein of unknown function [Amycolatopsis marina]|uniref:DUF397 domain-containing protein n=1 Tax=Amycolatopsis marina TaxID=490629 RepID=A0A1I0W396_9PSEU|nr:DUF397 domain-containing protein [Amycolatopsis marina]SFA83102.1 protein of unknown function [Amycolatopsis marina]